MKVTKIIRERLRKDTTSSLRVEKNRTRVSIDNMLQEQLVDYGDVLVFEATPQALDSTISVIDVPPLSLKYDIAQVDGEVSLFEARLRKVSLW